MISDVTVYSYNSIMTFFNRFGLSINTFILKHENILNTGVNFEFYEFTRYLNSVETLEEINNRFAGILADICNVISNNREDKSTQIVSQVNEYIERNFQDPNLSLYVIAEFLNKSPIYLGRLYKNLSSKSVQDAINEVRLKKSTKMLSETQLTIRDICSKIGISNEKYFYTLFKKHIGLTPNEYRTRMSS
jgi:two-component system response regulator YesN